VTAGEIEAIIDDYRVARELLVRSFSETIRNIGIDEAITRTELGERLGRPKSTVSHRVKAALERDLLSEEKCGGKRWLRRNGLLPEERHALPDVAEVEGFFYGVPAPRRSPCFDTFIHDFQKAGLEGVTAAEWAAWVGQPVEVVRERLEALVQAETLAHDENTARYAVRVVTEDLSD
jgi:DNA-binding transcriptional ArsR family regulator